MQFVRHKEHGEYAGFYEGREAAREKLLMNTLDLGC